MLGGATPTKAGRQAGEYKDGEGTDNGSGRRLLPKADGCWVEGWKMPKTLYSARAGVGGPDGGRTVGSRGGGRICIREHGGREALDGACEDPGAIWMGSATGRARNGCPDRTRSVSFFSLFIMRRPALMC